MCRWEVNMSTRCFQTFKKMAGKVQNRQGGELMLCNLARSIAYFATAVALPCFIATAAPSAAQADEAYSVIAIVQLPPKSQPLKSTDIAWWHKDTYGLADRQNKSVDIINTRTNDTIKLVTATPAFAGNVTAPPQSAGPNGQFIRGGAGDDNLEVWAGDGPVCPDSNPEHCTQSGSVKVINVKSRKTKVIYVNPSTPAPGSGLVPPDPLVTVHGRIDELCFNSASNVVMAASNNFATFGDRFVSFIDAHSFNILATIRLDGTDAAATDPDTGQKITAVTGAIEQCQANRRDGKFYVSIPNIGNGNGAVLRFAGTAPFHLDKVFTIAAATGCAGPAGLTIGPVHQILVGCNQKSAGQSVIIDDRGTGLPIYVPTTWGVDEVWYDRGSNHYYLAQSCTPTLATKTMPAVTCVGVTVMNVWDAGRGQVPPNPDNPPALTAPQSKNPAADPGSNFVYLPVLAKSGTGGICSTIKDVNGHTGIDDTQGCIAIYSAPLDGDDRRRGASK
jgi:hypothetical protein